MIELTIDINKKTKKNVTILHISLEKGLCEIVKLLLSHQGVLEFCQGEVTSNIRQ